MIAPEPTLGTDCEILFPGEKSAKQNRFRLQDKAADLLPGERVSKCLRCIAPGAIGASVMAVPGEKRAFYRNLITCDNVWHCPVCAEKIATTRREELAQAIAKAYALGWTPVLITFTLRHNIRQGLAPLLEGLLTGIKHIKRGRFYDDLREEYGWEGGIRSLEITYGDNGWHPHCHDLVFLSGPMNDIFANGLRELLAEKWQQVLTALGYDASIERGIDVRIADKDIADYMARFGKEPMEHGWTAADELAKSGLKKAHKDGYTPFQLLDLADLGDQAKGRLFQEYAAALKKHHQHTWSPGLRAKLGLTEAATDQDANDQDEAGAVEVAILPPDHWKRICKAKKRADLLQVAAQADRELLARFLGGFGLSFFVRPEKWGPPSHPGP